MLSHLGCHQTIQPGNTPRHWSHLADEVRHPPSSRKHHDRSLGPMLNSVKPLVILSNSSPEKTAQRKGVRVLQSDFRRALHALVICRHADWPSKWNLDIRIASQIGTSGQYRFPRPLAHDFWQAKLLFKYEPDDPEGEGSPVVPQAVGCSRVLDSASSAMACRPEPSTTRPAVSSKTARCVPARHG